MRRLHRLGLLLLLSAGCQTSDRLPGQRQPRHDATRPTGDWLDGPVTANEAPPARRDPKPLAGRDTGRSDRGALGGIVEDPDGRPAKSVSVEYAAADGSDGSGAPLDVLSDNAGRFQIYGLRPDTTYVLTARSRFDGKDCAARAYARTGQSKSQQQVIRLNPELSFPAPSVPRSDGPKTSFPGSPRPNAPPDTSIPSPYPAPKPLTGSSSLPARSGELGAPRPAADVNDWSPVSPPSTAPTPTVGRPDLRTDGPSGLSRPPVTSVPGPETRSEKQSESRSVPIRPRSEFLLLDAVGLDREFPTGRANSLVLLEFMSTTCVPCKKAIPTLKDLQTRHAGRGLEVVAVLCDDKPRAERLDLAAKYQKQHDLNYTVTTEPGPHVGALLERFGVEKYPTAVLINGGGERLWHGHPGDTEALEKAIREASK